MKKDCLTANPNLKTQRWNGNGAKGAWTKGDGKGKGFGKGKAGGKEKDLARARACMVWTSWATTRGEVRTGVAQAAVGTAE